MGRLLRKVNRVREEGSAAGTPNSDASAEENSAKESSAQERSLVERVSELRQLTIDARDLSEPVTYFHDELAHDPRFMALGGQAHDELIAGIVRAAAQRAIPGLELTRFGMRHIPEQRMWHGSGVGEMFGVMVFYYFEDIQVGIGHCVLASGAAQNHYVRFTGFALDRPTLPSILRRGQA